MKKILEKSVFKISFCCFFLFCLFLFSNFSVSYASDNVIADGQCGQNLIWELTDDGTITISGKGAMDNYSNYPWEDYKSQIKRVVFEEGVTYIGTSAFEFYSSIQSVSLANSVESTGSYCFSGCTSLTEMSFGNDSKMKSIGQLFFARTKVTEVIIPESVTSIGQYCFENCSALKTVVFPDNLESVGVDLLRNCNNLERCYVNTEKQRGWIADFASAGRDVVKGKNITDNGLRYVYNDNEIEVLGYDGTSTEITIPAEIDSKSVTSVGMYSFVNDTSIARAVLPSSVTQIGEAAFSGCSLLSEIEIAEGLKIIGSESFKGCSSLQMVTIPSTTESIDSLAFRYCSSLNEIYFKSSAIEIGAKAFSDLPQNSCISVYSENVFEALVNGSSVSEWTTIQLLDANGNVIRTKAAGDYSEENIIESGRCGVSLIWELTDTGTLSISGKGAMDNYSNYPWENYKNQIKKVVFEEGITYIGTSAFEFYSGIESVTLANSIESTGSYCFSGCTNLREMTFGNNSKMKSIGQLFFARTKVTEVIIPESVTYIGQYCFENCSALKTVVFPDGLESVGVDLLRNCNNLERCYVNTEKQRGWIADFASAGRDVVKGKNITDSGLRYVYNDNEIEILGYDGSSTEITIPAEIDSKSVTSVGMYSFVNDTSIAKVFMPASVTQIGEAAFSGCTRLSEIEMAEGLKTIGSESFKNCSIVQKVIIPSTIETIESLAFRYCTALKEVEIRAKTVEVGTKAFSDLADGSLIAVHYDELLQKLNGEGLNAVLKHTWNTEYTVDKEASCSEEGSKSIHCSVCGAKDESTVTVISKTDHDYGDWKTIKGATCTEDGTKEKVCSGCGDKITETIPSPGHTCNTEYTVDKEASCSEEGSKSIHCSVCGAKDESTVTVISATGHKWNANPTIDKTATCIEEGSKSIHCSVCGAKDESTITAIPVTDHKWNTEYTVDKNPTYAATGSKSIHCSVCDTKKPNSAVSIPKLKLTMPTVSKPTAAKKGFTVKWKKVSAATGYQVQYALNSKFTKSKKTVKITKATTLSKKVTKLKVKKKYYVRVRAYKVVSGKTYYSVWCKYKTVTTKK